MPSPEGLSKNITREVIAGGLHHALVSICARYSWLIRHQLTVSDGNGGTKKQMTTPQRKKFGSDVPPLDSLVFDLQHRESGSHHIGVTFVDDQAAYPLIAVSVAKQGKVHDNLGQEMLWTQRQIQLLQALVSEDEIES